MVQLQLIHHRLNHNLFKISVKIQDFSHSHIRSQLRLIQLTTFHSQLAKKHITIRADQLQQNYYHKNVLNNFTLDANGKSAAANEFDDEFELQNSSTSPQSNISDSLQNSSSGNFQNSMIWNRFSGHGVHSTVWHFYIQIITTIK